jgi:hypothetical protein
MMMGMPVPELGKKKDWLEYVSISRHISFYSL